MLYACCAINHENPRTGPYTQAGAGMTSYPMVPPATDGSNESSSEENAKDVRCKQLHIFPLAHASFHSIRRRCWLTTDHACH